jgi:hypothetical protein
MEVVTKLSGTYANFTVSASLVPTLISPFHPVDGGTFADAI